MSRLRGHGTRTAIAFAVGTVTALVAAAVTYRIAFAAMYVHLAKAGETGRVWWMLAIVALIFGSAAHSVTFKLLERRARRLHDDARIPRARVQ